MGNDATVYKAQVFDHFTKDCVPSYHIGEWVDLHLQGRDRAEIEGLAREIQMRESYLHVRVVPKE